MEKGIEDTLTRNKYATDNEKGQSRKNKNKKSMSKPGDGTHGLFLRKLEQICGQEMPPGMGNPPSDGHGWEGHEEAIRAAQTNLRKKINVYKEKCQDYTDKSIDITKVEEFLTDKFRPSPRDFLGRNHPICKEILEYRRKNDFTDIPFPFSVK